MLDRKPSNPKREEGKMVACTSKWCKGHLYPAYYVSGGRCYDCYHNEMSGLRQGLLRQMSGGHRQIGALQ